MIEVVKHSLMITGFVFVMMLVIEYLNVLTSGAWQRRVAGPRLGQYMLAAVLGVIPGCLGAFMVVAMYSHRVMTLGAVVTAMIATSGDGSFVMLAMIPQKALLLAGILFVIGIIAGVLTDIIAGKRLIDQPDSCEGLEVHEEKRCECFQYDLILRQWKECSASRGILVVVLTLFVVALVFGQVGPAGWNWIRVSLLIASVSALFIVSTVPDHFLEEHLWRHVARKHVPQTFLWIFGALLLMYILGEHLQIDLKNTVKESKWIVLLAACLVGLIPDSGPQLIFVTLFARGTIPFSILLANSIVQDGHGMLPMLAHSRHAFFLIKAINFAVGILIGGLAMAAGL